MTYFKKIICFLLGCFIIQIGVAFFINANTGGDSCVVFAQGISNTLHITVGTANTIFLCTALVILLLFARNKIGLGTFLAAFGTGIFLDVSNMVIQKLSLESLPYVVRLFIVAGSCIIIAVGFSIQKTANLGVAPHDELPFLVSDATKIQYRWIRIGFDVTYVVIGYLLGGVLGLGTIVATLLLGPTIQFCLPKVQKTFIKFIDDDNDDVVVSSETS